MLANQWYAVLEGWEVPRGRPVGATRLGRRMVFWRDESGRVHCADDRCCHRGAALSAGRLEGDGVACPFHGFVHEGDGRVSQIPANGRATAVPGNFRVDAWPVREAHGFVWLWFGAFREDLPPLPFFEDLVEGWSWGTVAEEWPVHYTRAVENQLDVVHLPFVHRRSIGRSGATLVHGPVVKVEGDSIRFWVFNARDDGRSVPMKPDALDPSRAAVELEFRFGNIWQNKLSDRFRVFLAFVPVDEARTRLYLRIYQNFFRVPIADRVVNRVLNWFNLRILHEDRDVVLTQEPTRSWLTMGENLVQGDLPVVAFRRVRRQKADASGVPDGPG